MKNLTLLVASLYIAVGLAAVLAYAQRGGVQSASRPVIFLHHQSHGRAGMA